MDTTDEFYLGSFADTTENEGSPCIHPTVLSDATVLSCIEHIALEGPEGCTLARLWSHVGDALHLKEGIWLGIRNRKELSLLFPAGPHQLQFHTTSLKQAEELGCKVVASQALRERVLGIYDPFGKLNAQQLAVLEILGKARHEGILHSRMAKQLKLDNKNLFHVVKLLKSRGLVHSQNVMLKESGRSIKTALLRLWRFMSQPNTDAENLIVPEEVLKTICAHLARAKEQVLVEDDLRKVMNMVGRKHVLRWGTLRQNLIKAGMIEYFKASVGGKKLPCLRLVSKNNGQSAFGNFEQKVRKGVMLSEHPVEMQLYHIINRAGSIGITQTELFYQSGLGRKYCIAKCKELIRYYGIVAVPENTGRQVTYRLFSPSHYEEGLLNSLVLARNEATIGDTLTSNSSRKRKAAASATSPSNSLPPQIEPDSKRSRIEEVSQHPTEDQAMITLKRRPVTVQYMRRRQFILELIEKEKILVKEHLRRKMSAFEGKESYALDSKSITRIIRAIEKEKLIKLVKVGIPMLSGVVREYNLLLQPSLAANDPAVRSFIDTLRETEVRVRTLSQAVKPEIELRDLSVERMTLPDETSGDIEEEEKPSAKQIAKHYGFSLYKMERARLLHEYIWKSVCLPGSSAETPTFLMSELLRRIPVALYLKIIGQYKIVDGLDEAIRRGLTVRELSLDIRKVLFRRRLFCRYLYDLLEILKKLGLISAQSQNSMETLLLVTRVEIPFTTASAGRILKPFTFKMLADVQNYWEELENLSIRCCPPLNSEQDKSNPPPEPCSVYDGKIAALNNRRSWPQAQSSREFMGNSLAHPFGCSRKRKTSCASARHPPPSQPKRRRVRFNMQNQKLQQNEGSVAQAAVSAPSLPSIEEEKEDEDADHIEGEQELQRIEPTRKQSWTGMDDVILLRKLREFSSEDFEVLPPPYSPIWKQISEAMDRPAAQCYLHVSQIFKTLPASRLVFRNSPSAKEGLPVGNMPYDVNNFWRSYRRIGSSHVEEGPPILSAVEDLYKMVLVGSQSETLPSPLHKLFQQFKEDELRLGLMRLRRNNWIVKARPATQFRFHLSNQWRQQADADHMQRLAMEASSYSSALFQEAMDKELRPVAIPSLLDGGTVAAILSAISIHHNHPQIRLEIDPDKSYWQKLDGDIDVVRGIPSAMRGSVKHHLLSISSLPFSARDRGQGQVSFPQEIRVAFLSASMEDASLAEVVKTAEFLIEASPDSRGNRAAEDQEALPLNADLNDADKELYSFIDQEGESGVAHNSLQSITPTPEETEPLGLQQLLNTERIFRVASTEGHRYVSDKHYPRWSFPLLTGRAQEAEVEKTTTEESSHASIRLWQLPDGSLNTAFLTTMTYKVLGVIMAHPGIYENKLHEEIAILGLAGLREILDTLLLEGAIVARRIAFQKPSLFSSSEEVVLPRCSLPLSSGLTFSNSNTEQRVCYYPANVIRHSQETLNTNTAALA